jgi:hypothetical protein
MVERMDVYKAITNVRKQGVSLNQEERESLKIALRDHVVDPSKGHKNLVKIGNEHMVTFNTIQKYLKDVIEELDIENIDYVRNKFMLTFNRLDRKVNDLLDKCETPEDTRRNIELMLKLMKEQTDFLERFHLKEKAKEHVVITEEKQLVIDKFEDVVDTEVIEE